MKVGDWDAWGGDGGFRWSRNIVERADRRRISSGRTPHLVLEKATTNKEIR